MRTIAILILCSVTVAWNTSAIEPDPAQCTVLPCDEMGVLGVPCMPHGNPLAGVTIFVATPEGIPIPDAFVEILFNHDVCQTGGVPILCICLEAVHSGYTDENGLIELGFCFGGCCLEPEACTIEANGIPIRSYDEVKSPDWNAERGDCGMGLPDFAIFGEGWRTNATGCTDYDYDGETGILDFSMFGSSWPQYCTAGR